MNTNLTLKNSSNGLRAVDLDKDKFRHFFEERKPRLGTGSLIVITCCLFLCVWLANTSARDIGAPLSPRAAFVAQLTRKLTVRSSNPASGVSISISPNDNNGKGNGVTSFVRIYNNGITVTLTAPPDASGNSFQKWQRDGTDLSTSRMVNVIMDGDHTMTAFYATTPPVTRTLTVASLNPPSGVSIASSPNDIGGQGGGVTQFIRTYNNNTVVTLTAPASAAGNSFQRWQRDGVDFGFDQTAIITMDANHTMTAVFGSACYTLTTVLSPSAGGSVTRTPQPNCAAPAAPSLAVINTSESDRVVGKTENLTQLFSKSQTGNGVPVIVGLRTSFIPEGSLGASEAIQSQRFAIAQSQDVLLSQMSAFSIRNVKKFAYIPYLAMRVDSDGLRFLESSAEVLSIKEDVAVAPSLTESVPLIGAPNAWASGFTGSGQTVAILDTGVDTSHQFFSGRIVSEACYSTNSTDPDSTSTSLCPGGVSQSTSPGSGINCDLSISGCFHGTHVAGIAAGKGAAISGVAKDANIIVIQVFSRFDNPNDCQPTFAPCVLSYESDWIHGLERVQTLSGIFNIAAANMSLGGGNFISNCDSTYAATKAAIDNLRSLGIATAIAAGNSGSAQSLAGPACVSTAVSVGSTGDGSDGNLQDVVSSFSQSATFLNLLAPGASITSSYPGGGFVALQGTSMAAPHVTGAWAVLKSRSPAASVSQILSALTTTGLPVTDSRNGLTKPRIRVDAAVNSLGGTNGDSAGTAVTLTATPNPGFGLQSWSGCDSTSGNNCMVTMTASRTVTANFVATHALTVSSVNPSSGVSITVSPNDNNGQGNGTTQFTRTFNNNTSVMLTAPASVAGNNFQKWQRDGADFSVSQTTAITLDANHTMTAVYVQGTPVTGNQTIGVYRSSISTFYLRNSNSQGVPDIVAPYGAPGDIPIVGDWDGNGTVTIGLYRPASSTFYLRNSNTTGVPDITVTFGDGPGGDIPIAGDWDGDGTWTIGVYRPSTSTFYLRNSNTAGIPDLSVSFGAPGDMPLVGDWDGNGTFTIGVFRPSSNSFFLRNSNSTAAPDITLQYGAPGDLPLAGDWDGNGTMTVGLFRPANGLFFLRNTNTVGPPDITVSYGAPGDKPIVGNWDGN